MDTKSLLKIIEEMLSKTATIEKNKKSLKEFLELNKKFQSELEK
jgi:hypothetical protein